MWFLLLQISLLLLMAAAFGAGLMWWWVRRRYEEAAERHEEMLLLMNRVDAQTRMTREEIKAGFSDTSAALTAIPQPDVAPLKDSLARIEHKVATIRLPETDLGPLSQRLDALASYLRSPDSGLEPIGAKLLKLESALSSVSQSVARLSNADLEPVLSRLGEIDQAMRSWKMPEVDLGPVHSGFLTLQLELDELKSGANVEALRTQLGSLEARLADQVAGLGQRINAAQKSDMDTLADLLSSLSTELHKLDAGLQKIDGGVQKADAGFQKIDALNAKVSSLPSDIEKAVSSIRIPTPDLRPIDTRLFEIGRSVAGLQDALRVMPALDLRPLESRLLDIGRTIAGVQEALQGLPEPDLSPVIDAVRSSDTSADMAAVENRLTAIEYSLAAMHHMLRARSEPSAAIRMPAARPANGDANVMPPPARPPREFDPIQPVLRPGDQANLLAEPAFGPPDNLEQLNGVGPILRGLLNDLGVYYFWQIAEWTPEEASYVDGKLMHFRGRIRRDDWINHARALADQPASAKRPMGYSARRPELS